MLHHSLSFSEVNEELNSFSSSNAGIAGSESRVDLPLEAEDATSILMTPSARGTAHSSNLRVTVGFLIEFFADNQIGFFNF